MTRTPSQKKELRDHAEMIIKDRDLILDDEETTGDNTCPIQTGPAVNGVVVDRRSEKGRIVVTGTGILAQYILTGPGENGNLYPEIEIRDGQTCVIYGYSTVLYFRIRQ